MATTSIRRTPFGCFFRKSARKSEKYTKKGDLADDDRPGIRAGAHGKPAETSCFLHTRAEDGSLRTFFIGTDLRIWSGGGDLRFRCLIFGCEAVQLRRKGKRADELGRKVGAKRKSDRKNPRKTKMSDGGCRWEFARKRRKPRAGPLSFGKCGVSFG